jgi:DNA-binding LacI/PurR family transcriptional regulator
MRYPASEKLELIQTGAPSFDVGRASLDAVLDKAKPTALICGGSEVSNGALDAALRRGLRLGDDFAFVGYGNPAFYEWIAGGVSTISLPLDILVNDTMALIDPDAEFTDTSTTVTHKAELVLRCST